MRFIDEVYALYRDQLTGDEEDTIAIVLGLLEEQNRKELIQLINEMSEDELLHMMTIYLVEMLRLKMDKDGVGSSDGRTHQSNKYH